MSSFPYTRGVPNPPADPSVDAPIMQINTNTVDDWVKVDHIGFGNATAGKHLQCTFPGVTSQIAPLDPVSILYTKNDAKSHPQLFFLNSQNSGQYVIGAANNAQGSIPLFGGVILQWLYTPTTPGGTPFSFPNPFPNYVFSVSIAGVAAGAQSFAVSGVGPSGGTIYNQAGGGNQNAYIIAIGF